MVHALLNDWKTQTRRLNDLGLINQNPDRYQLIKITTEDLAVVAILRDNETQEQVAIPCSFGKVGDYLRVREAFWAWGCWQLTGRLTKSGKPERTLQWSQQPESFAYCEQHLSKPNWQPTNENHFHWYKRPSIFLPTQFSRIVLEITNIRLERLRTITPEDAIAEGIERNLHFEPPLYRNYRVKEWCAEAWLLAAIESYHSLWDTINQQSYPWLSNPWAWVLEFRRIKNGYE